MIVTPEDHCSVRFNCILLLEMSHNHSGRHSSILPPEHVYMKQKVPSHSAISENG